MNGEQWRVPFKGGPLDGEWRIFEGEPPGRWLHAVPSEEHSVLPIESALPEHWGMTYVVYVLLRHYSEDEGLIGYVYRLKASP